jgi:hypothetical protein
MQSEYKVDPSSVKPAKKAVNFHSSRKIAMGPPRFL